MSPTGALEDDLQNHACPYARFALLKGYAPAVKACCASDEDGEPAQGEPDVCMRVDLLE